MNFTAIVGANATGKTNLMEFISQWVRNVGIEHIAIFKVGREKFKYMSNMAFGCDQADLSEFSDTQKHQTVLINSHFSHKKVISQPSKLNYTQRGLLENRDISDYEREWNLNPIEFFYFELFTWQLDYIKSACKFPHKNSLDHCIMHSRLFQFELENEERNSYYTRIQEINRIGNKFDLVKHELNRIGHANSIDSQSLKVLFGVYNLLVLTFLFDKYEVVRNHDFYGLTDTEWDDFIRNLSDDVKELFFENDPDGFKAWKNLTDKLYDLCDQESIIVGEFYFLAGYGVGYIFDTFYVRINGTEQISDLFQLIKKVPYYPSFTYFQWGMSTGEVAILSQFSKLYHAFNNNANFDKQNSVTICADEVDTFLHPNWSRKLISYYVKYLPDIIKEAGYEKHIHIIFSTHSPFILSDFPEGNVVHLGEDIKTTKTFGANIHDLLSDRFFLNEGFTGEFAKDYLETLLEDLYNQKDSNSEMSKDQFNAFDSRIKLIGDPVIKFRFQEILLSIPMETNDLKDELNTIEKRAEQIRRQLGL